MEDRLHIYGKDSEERIVGITPLDEEYVLVYTRTEEDRVERRRERLFPFLWTTEPLDPTHVDSTSRAKQIDLEGSLPYRYLLVFDSWQPMRDYAKAIDDETYYMIRSRESQYLMQSGKTLFKGMELEDLHRMQVDIETYSSTGRFSNADRRDDEVIIIAMSDNRGWSRIISRDVYKEDEMLIEMVREFHRRDPDIIEGHNIFGFDLPYLRDRARLHEVNLALGRDNKPPSTYHSKRKVAERDYEYEIFEIGGRHVIDTMFLAADFDVYCRCLPSLGLKDIAVHFNEAAPNREYVAGDQIAHVWDTNKERLLKYALDDVIETRNVAAILSQSVFYLTQMIPLQYQKVHQSGKARIIESLLVREYLYRKHSLPKPEEGRQEVGGLTGVNHTGVYENLVYADVSSLYPSIMLYYDIQPERDHLKLFQPILRTLTELRLRTKKASRETDDPKQAQTLRAREQAYKIVINSFYGMLGFLYAIFNDISEADRVTSTGQLLLRRLMELIEKGLGGMIIEFDTDGVLYTHPDKRLSEEDARAEVSILSDRMPEGIEIDLDGLFESMLSYKKKNYALRDYEGKIKFKGGVFKSRGAEPFGREFMQESARLLLNRDVQGLATLYRTYQKNIIDRQFGIDDYAKRANLKMTLDEYERTRHEEDNPNLNQMAQYELAAELDDRGGDIKTGDSIEYYVAGDDAFSTLRVYEAAKLKEDYAEDENVFWYLNRLRIFAEKWEQFFDKDDFEALFPKLYKRDFKDGRPAPIGVPANINEIKIQNREVK